MNRWVSFMSDYVMSSVEVFKKSTDITQMCLIFFSYLSKTMIRPEISEVNSSDALDFTFFYRNKIKK